jgi:hypothetical protein
LLAISGEANDSCRRSQGATGGNRKTPVAACRALYPDRTLHRHTCCAIATASPYAEQGRSFVDLERGIFYRKAIGKRATKKRQTPAPVPPRLLAHLRRWKERKLIANCFVEFNGKPVASVKKGFRRAVGLAKLSGKVTPHTLRHTAATWLMQRGVPIWEAAGFLGMSPDVLQDTYGHHHPDYLKGAAAAIGQKGRHVSVVESVVDLTDDRNQTKKPNDIWSEWQDSNLRPLRPERSALPG